MELVLIAVALSMDAFAVAMCKGLCMRKLDLRRAAVIALFFGVFQAVMPLIGWFLGTQFERLITPVDHWVAFVLLSYIGGKMLWDAFHEKDDAEKCDLDAKLDMKELFILAIATSIDALAAGITFAVLKTDIVPAVLLIGLITFLLSLVGVVIGNRFGNKYEKKAEILGGCVLILIGLKILLEHLNIISF
ncbi:MAG: manganese efflux pump MntP family protein [Eubacteriales bacterium]|nr:manganese efflux pump MntP family protein [Eubacteriales bacterium]